MATQPSDKVKLETMASLGSIPSTTRRKDFAVLVRVTAPPAGVSTGRRRSLALPGGVDLVAVLDVSESMKEENRLERMKKAMIFVIGKLGLGDRLAVVAFNGQQVQRLTELSMMSDKKNRADAKSEVGKLTAGGARGGGTNLSVAMEAAAAILGQRGEGERNNRVGRIIFLSNGDDDDDDDAGASTGRKNSSPELAAEAFALGADHDPNAMSFSKDETSGVYSYSNQDLDRIKDADSIRGLTSVDAAIGVQVDLQAHDGVAISALESGGRRVSVAGGGADDGRQSLTVYIHDLHAGEQKSFIVYLTVPEGKKELLLTAGGRYGDPENTTGGYNSVLDTSEVSVLRPDESSSPGDKITMIPEVETEFARARLPKGGVVPPTTTESKTTTYWWRVLPCVALLLILTALLVGNMSEEEEEGNKSGRVLDISQHPGWPKMEESLDATMLEMMEDVGITSLLHGAQVDDMSRSMNRYIYLALAHASVLGSRYGPVAALSGQDGASVLEQTTVERLEAETEELRINFVALAGEKVSVAADDCAASKQEALERIAELERQLQDKKVFADSLLSEVANADAHLKTCGQRVDMLEAKLTELEGAGANREASY